MTDKPELPVVESGDTFEIESPMPVGMRILLLLIALFPLLAPYELLLKPRWTDIVNVFFLFVALVSLGAMCVSALFAWAAVAGIRSRMTFDRARGLFTYTAWAPVMGTRSSRRRLDAIAALEIETHDWSDGAPSYFLGVVMADRQTFRSGSSWSREEVEAIRQRVAAFLGLD